MYDPAQLFQHMPAYVSTTTCLKIVFTWYGSFMVLPAFNKVRDRDQHAACVGWCVPTRLSYLRTFTKIWYKMYVFGSYFNYVRSNFLQSLMKTRWICELLRWKTNLTPLNTIFSLIRAYSYCAFQ